MTALNPHILPKKLNEKEEHVYSLAGIVVIAMLAIVIGILYINSKSQPSITASNSNQPTTQTIRVIDLPRGFVGTQYTIPLTVAINQDNLNVVVDSKSLPPGLTINVKERNCTDNNNVIGDVCGPNPFLEGVPTQKGNYTFIAQAANPVAYHLQIGW